MNDSFNHVFTVDVVNAHVYLIKVIKREIGVLRNGPLTLPHKEIGIKSPPTFLNNLRALLSINSAFRFRE